MGVTRVCHRRAVRSWTHLVHLRRQSRLSAPRAFSMALALASAAHPTHIFARFVSRMISPFSSLSMHTLHIGHW